MTRKKLKDWVIPALGLFVLIGALFLYYLLGNILNDNLVPENTYVTETLLDNTIDVNKEIEKKVIKPYTSDKVSISKYYYNSSSEEKKTKIRGFPL